MAKNKKDNRPSHSERLVQALKSLSVSATPLSSILPTDEKISVATSSQQTRSKGTKSPAKSAMPQKLLLQISDPGKAPSAPIQPKAVANPYLNVDNKIAQVTKTRELALEKRDKATFDEANKQLADLDNQRTGIANSPAAKAYSTYQSNYASWQTALNVYKNTTLPTYNTKVAQFNTDTATNTKRTTQYSKDIQKFMSTVGIKSKKNKGTRAYSKSSGSRNKGASSSKGSRS